MPAIPFRVAEAEAGPLRCYFALPLSIVVPTLHTP